MGCLLFRLNDGLNNCILLWLVGFSLVSSCVMGCGYLVIVSCVVGLMVIYGINIKVCRCVSGCGSVRWFFCVVILIRVLVVEVWQQVIRLMLRFCGFQCWLCILFVVCLNFFVCCSYFCGLQVGLLVISIVLRNCFCFILFQGLVLYIGEVVINVLLRLLVIDCNCVRWLFRLELIESIICVILCCLLGLFNCGCCVVSVGLLLLYC